MSSKALDGLDNLGKTKPKVNKGQYKAKPKATTAPVSDIPENVIRVPRTTPAAKADHVERFSEETTLIAHEGFGKTEITEARREQVLAWMLNGHLHNGRLMTVSELSIALDNPLKTIQHDVARLKEQMADFHTTEDLKDVPALAHMLMEMKFQDRGRALALYNIIMSDIDMEDAKIAAYIAEYGKPPKSAGLTGRDRAAMYSAALTALDLSNKATNGMESLFKITGGAQRLQQIIKVKNLTLNQANNVVFTTAQLQDIAAEAMGAVLPSARKANPQLVAPPTLDLDAEDIAVMKIGEGK